MKKAAGVTLPLSSVRSARDWGVGEVADLPACAAWLSRAGFGVVQILPVNELADGETSPYGARTAFGLDPIYLSIADIPELEGETDARFLGQDAERERQRLRALPRVDFKGVRALKEKALARAFATFHEREWVPRTARAKELLAFVRHEASWEDDLSLYVALREEQHDHGWETWPMPLRMRDPASLDDARARLELRILRHRYEQWLMAQQWGKARAAVDALGMKLMGDLPFVVGRESADAWARSRLFRAGSLGAPPDEFSPEGQDWGLPAYDWAALEATDYAWLRARVRHASRLYHAFRVDHLIGYFRQYVRKPKGEIDVTLPDTPEKYGVFDPPTEAEQAKHGETLLSVMAAAKDDAELIAEDLGVIPDFARETMKRLGLPGYKVILWERDEAGILPDPATYDETSVATWSTHDTQPITAWWDELDARDRTDLLALMKLDANAAHAEIDRGLFDLVLRAGSRLSLVLVTELLGDKTRINTPATVGDHNWTYRLPEDLETIESDPGVRARMTMFRELVHQNGRDRSQPPLK